MKLNTYTLTDTVMTADIINVGKVSGTSLILCEEHGKAINLNNITKIANKSSEPKALEKELIKAIELEIEAIKDRTNKIKFELDKAIARNQQNKQG